MKEDIFDVLIYLFENYFDDDQDSFPDSAAITSELLEAGFQQPDVNKAFEEMHLEDIRAGDRLVLVPPAAVERAIALSHDKYCSVWHSLRQDIGFSTTYDLVP